MSVITGLAIYVILWWLVLFAVLPFGVRTQEEAGDIVHGSTPSAPIRPFIVRKMIATTLVSGLIFAAMWAAYDAGYTLDDIPFMRRF
jgi:predicted secreted protein